MFIFRCVAPSRPKMSFGQRNVATYIHTTYVSGILYLGGNRVVEAKEDYFTIPHLTYSKNGGNLGLVLKMKTIACISILLTKHVKYIYLYLFKFVLYSTVAFKVN